MNRRLLLCGTLFFIATTFDVAGFQPPRRALRPSSGASAAPPARLPEGFKKVADVEYAEADGNPLLLDLYVPERPPVKALPLVVWIHGGGWQAGDKAQARPSQDLLAHGYAAASINYRLTDEASFPAQIHDCKAAIRWLRAHAAEYGYDPERIGVFGSSAGGHLAALVGTSGGLKGLEGTLGDHLGQSSAVQAVCDYYGPTDLAAFVETLGYTRHATADAPEAKLLGGPVLENREAAARANPITYVDANDPPFYIVHGDSDPVVPPNQSELLDAALRKAGVSTKLTILAGAKHGGPEFAAPAVADGVVAFFDRHLKGAAAARDKAPAATKQASPQSATKAGAQRDVLKSFQLDGTRFTFDDGRTRFDGIFLKPAGDGPFPAILISHGKGGGAQGFSLDKARELATWGFVCIGPNYTHGVEAGGPPGMRRGPAGFGGRPDAAPRGQAAGRAGMQDLSTQGASEENLRRAEACLDVLAALPHVDARRIAAYGNSMGAFVTIGLAGRAPERLAAAAITAGGVNDRAGFAAPSYEVARQVRCPMLIMHGDADTVVAPEKSAALQNILDERKTPNRRELVAGGGHNIHQAESAQVYGWMRGWFQEHGVLK
ncbi:MAG: prolyl oligopeptidase family serine peptidase [Planctomycetaceae bacterium]|nr:prolyl oligopeptidase family serine peptidase [Planctomycetaceae bacterium]